MSIHKLPDYVINRLKAGEVVERPSSILKELVENSLDAGATILEITVNDGGKSYLSVQDNGSGIELSDMDLVLERYATSKLKTDEDLFSIASYGFRGEALASVAEVSKTTLLTKTSYAQIGSKLVKKGGETIVSNQSVGFEHGTLVSVEDLFFNVPARLKFLKSAQTEFFYCYNYFVDIVLLHWDKARKLKKNDKMIFDLKPTSDLKTRVLDVFKQDWNKNLQSFDVESGHLHLYGILGDASLRFGSRENMKIYVNGRPVQDKIISRAIMDAYHRQITPGEYPLVVLMLDIDAKFVDVNVHPAKLNVKFADSQAVFELVEQTVSKTLGGSRIASTQSSFSNSNSYFSSQSGLSQGQYIPSQSKSAFSFDTIFDKKFTSSGSQSGQTQVQSMFGLNNFTEEERKTDFHHETGDYQIIGQVRNSYIVMQSADAIYYIDQHALAERIAYETMKKEEKLVSERLLQPLKFEILKIADLDEKIEELNELGFDIAMLGENVIIVYAIPSIFVKHPVDLKTLFNYVLFLEKISFDQLMDEIYASRACKTSIKAGNRLSLPQMEQLVRDGLEKIPGLFVCQHGRPFFWKIDKGEIDKLFDR
ncbi:DNA mismatch repair protein MutL [candidate division SR1 bacterium]|nr:DNA mismatch repair protein MutL [candidate division SR1 bacterium]